ncbi:phage tail protein [Clostridium sp. YIM B02505]|uniref:Phage tail protein n=1 Tax=Clostridium yunnanense TaxID=2800325 RepID=A0ABS1EID5_9CLOT|nr:phage tail spike protein [Clostridium yunnanense]MBK1809126.1 phage tail protein [Clostridium yunnanense]
MITVHSSTTTDFNNNGLAVLTNIIKTEVNEVINGDFRVTLTYPLSDKKSRYLVKYNIIKAMTPVGYNIFRIEKSRRSNDGNSIECICLYEGYYSLSRNFLRDVRPTNTNGLGALTWMKDHAESPVRFNFLSDIDKIGTAYYIRKNFLDAIMGDDDNSFLKVWGGELDRRIDSIGIYRQLGTDRGFKVTEGKNLITIEESTEGTEVTRLMVTGRDENDNVLELPEKYVDSPLINNYSQISYKHIDFPNVKVSRDDTITEYSNKEAVYAELRKQGALLYSEQHIDRPSVNFSIEFADLSKTGEYKDIKALQQLYLGDIVTIHSNKLGIDIKARLISYTYDCVLQKYTKLELGDYVKSEYTVSNILNNRIATVSTESNFIGDKIKQALGGHCIKREGEILIMDTDNIATATKVWRWNLNGFGYSSTGYNGTFGTAINMDGEINASFIKTGELDASLIKAGTISSADGTFKLDLGSGALTTYDLNGRKAIEMINQNIIVYDFDDDNASEVGRITSAVKASDTSKKALVIGGENGRCVSIGKKNNQGTYDSYVDYDMGALGLEYPITFYKDVKLYGDISQKLNNGYYHPVCKVQSGNVWLTTNQEIRIDLDNAFNYCSFKTVKAGVIGTYRNTYNSLGEFYLNSYYIENNQLVLKGGVTHLVINNGTNTWLTDGQINVQYQVIGSK